MPDATGDPVTYRIRAREGLLTYPYTGSIPLHACRTDKMEIRLRGTVTYQEAEQLKGRLYLMSSMASQANPGLLTAPSAGGWRQSVRADVWHFIGPVTYHHFNATFCTVDFDLTINPTCFAEHCCRLFNPTTIEDLRRIPLLDLLRIDHQVAQNIRTTTLDAGDNIISSSRWLTYISQNWSSFVELYVQAISSLIERLFNGHMSDANDVGAPPMLHIGQPSGSSLNIGYVEQYVEFRVQDARRELGRIAERLRLAASDLSETTVPGPIHEGRENSATWVSMRLRANLNLKCYAKEEGRIRVEVEYGGRSAHGRSIGTLIASGRWPSWATLAAKIGAIQADGARRIDRVMNSLRPVTLNDHSGQDEAFTELVNILASGRFDDQAAWQFLKSLLSDRVVRGRRDSHMAKIGEAMVRRGIMARSTITGRTRFRCFIPHEGLLRALVGLREVPNADGRP